MKHKSLTLSLVIPVFNEEDHLDACLKAVVSQTVQPDEVIIVDNNSSDKSLEIAERYKFVKILQESKQGVLFARNRGFDFAKGEIIGRIDADTILSPRWIESVKKVFLDADIAAVTGPVNYYDMPFADTNHHPDHFMRSSIYNWAPKSPFLFGSNMAIKKSVWNDIKASVCSDNYIHEDLDLAIHLYLSDQKIHYTKSLLSGASGRRYNDSPSQFYHYMSLYRQSYLRHNLHSLAIYSATGVYGLGYVVFHPWLKAWYKLYSYLKPLTPLTRYSRKNPMNG